MVDVANPKDEARRLLRRSALLNATLTGSSIKPHHVTVIDLTGYGCGLEGALRTHAGECLVLTIEPIGPLAGKVIWWSEGRLGLEFLQPLHPAVIDHIRLTNAGPPRLPEAGVWSLLDYPSQGGSRST